MRTYEYEQKLIFLAFRSDSQTLVDTQKLVAPERFKVKIKCAKLVEFTLYAGQNTQPLKL